jgi:hypothetical protein
MIKEKATLPIKISWVASSSLIKPWSRFASCGIMWQLNFGSTIEETLLDE